MTVERTVPPSLTHRGAEPPFQLRHHPTAPLSVFKLSLHGRDVIFCRGDRPSIPGRISAERNTQHQSPSSRESSKSQNTKPPNRRRGKRRAARFLSLELGASLEVGVWDLELFAWALGSSKIEIRLIPWAHRSVACVDQAVWLLCSADASA